MSKQLRTAVVWATAAAFLFKLTLALRTFGTNDVLAFERFALYARYFGAEAYRITPPNPGLYLNWPPFALTLVRAIAWLASVTPLPFPFWLRLPAILCDAGSVWLVWKLTRRESAAILLMAIAPVSIMVSGFHGQFDPVMIFLLLLAVWLAESNAPALGVGAAIGLAISVKLPAAIVIPAIFLHQRGLWRKIAFAAGIAATVLLTWQPYLFQDPLLILRSLLGYRSFYGFWGLAYVSSQLSTWIPGLAWLDRAFQASGAFMLLGACVLVTLWMHRLKQRPSLFSQCGLLFFLFLSLSNGFGIQYMTWLVPWVVEIGVFAAGVHYAAAGLFAFVVYNCWAHGLPWYLAIAGEFSATAGLCQLVAWVSVVWVLWLIWGRMKGTPNQRPTNNLVAAGLLAGVLLYAATDVADFQTAVVDAHAHRGPAQVPAFRAEVYRQLAGDLRESRRWADAITALNTVVQLDPNAAQAYCDRGAAHVELAEWDAAVADEMRALQIQPDLVEAQIKLSVADSRTRNETPALSTDQYLIMSRQLYAAGRYQECIDAAQAALRREPDIAEAYNNIAAAFNSLGRWDDGIQAAERAVRLRPDMAIAQNNLEWARQQKARRGR